MYLYILQGVLNLCTLCTLMVLLFLPEESTYQYLTIVFYLSEKGTVYVLITQDEKD